ncbi:MAG: hypothetical protein H6708_10720 [Kofleriaceae bacterium]|nr:hypothetical protein [Kofleriaceae bacterium]
MTNRITFTLASLALIGAAGCSMISKGKATTGGGGDDATDGPALAGTMAEAPVYHRGATIAAPAECHTSGYARFDAPAGEAMTLEVSVAAPADACVSVWWLNSNGGAAGVTAEVCSNDSPKTFDVAGQDGGAFLQISEAGACQGASVTLAVK